ncbi:hypothetical protein RF11_00027 [Thelohanellus kitauei]|uniref:Uncharacterized protein n=1 Tax=Thelohanellus kitauei TaxID=669202 RepID=A0A0C2JX50_THEKT|nr:hypothetical protein RF11_00027 [Thelohanellus kitauei]
MKYYQSKAKRELATLRTVSDDSDSMIQKCVIIAYSGGLFSSVMLHLLYTRLKELETFAIIPIIIHINNHGNTKVISDLEEYVKKYSIEFRIVNCSPDTKILDKLAETAKLLNADVYTGSSASHCCVEALKCLRDNKPISSLHNIKIFTKGDRVDFSYPTLKSLQLWTEESIFGFNEDLNLEDSIVEEFVSRFATDKNKCLVVLTMNKTLRKMLITGSTNI